MDRIIKGPLRTPQGRRGQAASLYPAAAFA